MAEYRTVTRVATLSDNICKVNGTSQNVIVVDPYIEIEQTDEGAVITVTDAHQTTQATIYNGPPGPVGPGVASGGQTGQYLRKASDEDYDTEWASASSQSFVHIQSVASAEWIINHDLNKFPSVTVVDSAGNVVFGNVQYIGETQIIITFCAPFSGKAILN